MPFDFTSTNRRPSANDYHGDSDVDKFISKRYTPAASEKHYERTLSPGINFNDRDIATRNLINFLGEQEANARLNNFAQNVVQHTWMMNAPHLFQNQNQQNQKDQEIARLKQQLAEKEKDAEIAKLKQQLAEKEAQDKAWENHLLQHGIIRPRP